MGSNMSLYNNMGTPVMWPCPALKPHTVVHWRAQTQGKPVHTTTETHPTDIPYNNIDQVWHPSLLGPTLTSIFDLMINWYFVQNIHHYFILLQKNLSTKAIDIKEATSFTWYSVCGRIFPITKIHKGHKCLIGFPYCICVIAVSSNSLSNYCAQVLASRWVIELQPWYLYPW